ncbi:hypothetical protein PRK78_004650 [Emydomyces testavorans]|uniref:Uncharacterized protein n=1 Tax=Emydomyces testavorans TaxID=2070801 RepID=A0AAF0DKM0_9EURO|nr:hypothetical protein PRK78_004650 [Emydomyces testavorans]
MSGKQKDPGLSDEETPVIEEANFAIRTNLKSMRQMTSSTEASKQARAKNKEERAAREAAEEAAKQKGTTQGSSKEPQK